MSGQLSCVSSIAAPLGIATDRGAPGIGLKSSSIQASQSGVVSDDGNDLNDQTRQLGSIRDAESSEQMLSSSSSSSLNSSSSRMIHEEGCCTPKSKSCRIPELLQCPPAPRKPRAILKRKRIVPPSSYFIIQDFDFFFPLRA